MMQVFHLKVSRAGQMAPAVVDMHNRIAFRADREALADLFSEEARWRERGLAFELVAEVEGDDLERAFSATNHIESDWTQSPDVSMKTSDRCRSTSVGDLVVRDGATFIVDYYGFSEIQRPGPEQPEVEQEPADSPRV